VSILLPLAGGALIGLAVAAMALLDGRIAGISGIVGGVVRPVSGDAAWRVLFVLGLLAGGLAFHVASPSSLAAPAASLPVLAGAGLLVGVGTRLAGGCTSGHRVRGTSRGSLRSIAATLTLLVVGALVVFIVRHAGVR